MTVKNAVFQSDLSIGAIVRAVDERGAYARRLDYTQPPPPPDLTPDEQSWLQDLFAPYRPSTPPL